MFTTIVTTNTRQTKFIGSLTLLCRPIIEYIHKAGIYITALFHKLAKETVSHSHRIEIRRNLVQTHHLRVVSAHNVMGRVNIS